jgi:hypothetical protein
MASTPGAGHIVAMGGGGFSMEPDDPLESSRLPDGSWRRDLPLTLRALMTSIVLAGCIGCRERVVDAGFWFEPIDFAWSKLDSPLTADEVRQSPRRRWPN